MRSRLGPFGHMPFAVYWTGGLLSNIGTWLQAVVGSVFVYDRTGSALAVGVLNFATFLPVLIFSVWGGVLSDRFDRRHITVVTHAASLAVGTVLAVLSFTGNVTEVHVVVTAFLLQTSWAIAKPSVISLLPALVSSGGNVSTALRQHALTASYSTTTLFSSAAQGVWAGVALAALAVLVLRRHSYERLPRAAGTRSA